MSDTKTESVHWSFWAICIVMFIWNALGAINFIVQMNPDMIESYRETERAIIVGRPNWATVGFALAVFGGTAGCGLLLLRKSIALYIFVISLVGVIVTIGYALSIDINFGFGEIIGIILMPLIVAVFLVWYSSWNKAKGWIT
jgi:hypothetical protein